MFTSQKMFLIDLLVLKKDENKVSQFVVESGIFEPSSLSFFVDDPEKWVKEQNSDKKKIMTDYERYAVEIKNFFEKYASNERNDATLLHYKSQLSIPAIGDILRSHQNKAAYFQDKFMTVRKKKEEVAVKIAGLRMHNQSVRHAEQLKDPQELYSVLGVISIGNLELLKHEFVRFNGEMLTEGHINDSEIVFLAVSREHMHELNSLLERVYFINYGLPAEFFGKGTANMMELGLEFTILCDEELLLENECQKAAPEILRELRQIFYSISLFNKISEVNNSVRQAGHFVLFSGWIAAKEFKNFKIELEKLCGQKYEMHITNTDYFSTATDIPTKLGNPRIFKPFETLVTLFGIPSYREIDPTPLVAILYVVMYGAMFGDVGQGLVLLSFGLIGLLFKKSAFRLIFSLMVWVGISSTVFGFFYGSIFGYEDIIPHLWLSPMYQTTTLLTYSVCFGIGVIILGYLLGMVNAIKIKDWQMLIFSHKGIVAFIIYLMFLTIGYKIIKSETISLWLVIPIIILSIFLGLERVWDIVFYGHGKLSEWWMGIFDMFEFYLSLLSNTISFVRIGAFALTHAALMLAIFALKDLSSNPIVGNIILLFGNLFVIFFEGFIVGIQTLRLEYYEFFVRFFKGSGRLFKPVNLNKDL